jgi:hypothetical protein
MLLRTPHRRNTPRLTSPLAALLALTAALTLTACGPYESRPHSTPTATPTASATAGFASDEEALAAAEKVYREYLEVSDGIAQAGGEGADRLKPLVTSEQFDKEEDYFAEMRAKGTHLDGRVVLASTTLQSSTMDEVVIYGCLDLSAARYIDASGADVTAPSRPDRIRVEVIMTNESNNLLIESMSPWSTSC